ncbi:hypothetical protein PTKIN_Ptkin14bG0057800 [Pterospermum kingtungense]
MVSSSKVKSIDFYRKIARDLTEASFSSARLSIVAALALIFLFGTELNNYSAVSTSTFIVLDNSSDGDFLRIGFNISFPALSCDFASMDVYVVGTNWLNITKTIRRFPIYPHSRPTSSESHSRPITQFIKHGDEAHEEAVEGAIPLNDVSLPITQFIKHGDEAHEEAVEGAIPLNGVSFDKISHLYPIIVVNFYASWCYWSTRLKPEWDKAAEIIKERYDPEIDGRIFVAKFDCTVEVDLCKRHHIQGYPSIRILRNGSDIVREENGHHDHETYYGDRDAESLVEMMEGLIASIPLKNRRLALEDQSIATKRPPPLTGGCRIEGYALVKKVPGNLVISAGSGAHAFDASQMNMSHVINHLSFGKTISPRVLSANPLQLPLDLSLHFDRKKTKLIIELCNKKWYKILN